MPPKTTLTKEIIADAAFELVREHGFEALTARSIAQKLGCSTQPIYSAYGNMSDIKNDVYGRAVAFALASMESYKDESYTSALNLAIGSLHFAKNEKQLFQTVYLSGYKTYDLAKDSFIGEEMFETHLRSRGRLSVVEDEKRKKIMFALSIYVIGLGTMINTGTLNLDIKEATRMIQDLYEAMLMKEGIIRS
ncbi:TetR/AcrR family transcriptional regulator [Paenibacillus sedimenti]|uniref:TetR/AcrR family transcriptional regulator n=1 Tax=Paenibacillus sedimenti TaxID=2770274 RepID=A0A926QJP5_9BACL|nr:TetR/AcrR family transcriptional regulator [Paenibacillus sedimenti]MBD0380923.1 TetR/AcrR family transcriptional regulator [Paenibacillus sedimenti]